MMMAPGMRNCCEQAAAQCAAVAALRPAQAVAARAAIAMSVRVMKEWPAFRMARDLADGKVFPCSEQVILQAARKHEIGRKLGRSIIFSPDDCQRLYEVLPCPSGSCADRSPPTGSSAAPSAASALKKALALTTRKSRKRSAPSVRPNSLPNPSTAVALPRPLPKRR